MFLFSVLQSILSLEPKALSNEFQILNRVAEFNRIGHSPPIKFTARPIDPDAHFMLLGLNFGYTSLTFASHLRSPVGGTHMRTGD